MKEFIQLDLCHEIQNTPTPKETHSGSINTGLLPELLESQDSTTTTNLEVAGFKIGDRVLHKKFCQGLAGTILEIKDCRDYAWATVEFPSRFVEGWTNKYPCNISQLELVKEAIA